MNEVSVRVTCNEPGAYHERLGSSVLAMFVQDSFFGTWAPARVVSAHARQAADEWRASIETSEHPSDVLWPFGGSGLSEAGARPDPLTYLVDDVPITDQAERQRVAALVDRAAATGKDLPATVGRAQVSVECGCGIRVNAQAERVWPILDVLAKHRLPVITLRQLAKRLTAEHHR